MAPPHSAQILDGTTGHEPGEVPPSKLKRWIDQDDDIVLLDVRSPQEYDDWHIPGAKNVPFQDIRDGASIPATYEDTVVTVCAIGVRSAHAQGILEDQGYTVYNLHNGMQGWNRVFNVVPVTNANLPSNTQLLQVQRIGKGCLSYILISNGEALVVDPARDWEIYEEAVQSHDAEITSVIDTHAHADHVSGGPAMADELGIPYHLHPYDGIHPIDMLPADFAYEYIHEGSRLLVGDVEVIVLHIPGHTLGNTALLVGEKALLTGDSVFLDSIARPDLGGEAEAWTSLHHASLRRVLSLEDDTLVLPGHFADLTDARDAIFQATLGDLKTQNEGLQMAQESLAAFRKYIMGSLPSFPERYVDIKRVNAGLLDADEPKIEELEFGRQECAVGS